MTDLSRGGTRGVRDISPFCFNLKALSLSSEAVEIEEYRRLRR